MGARTLAAWVLCCAFAGGGLSRAAAPAGGELLEAPRQWVVYPASHPNPEIAALVERATVRAIEQAFGMRPGGKRAGGIVFSHPEGVVPGAWHETLERLQAMPGVVGAAPVPSASDLLAARARQLARGGVESMASGLIVKYRAGEKRAHAKAGGRLASAELSALASAAGVPLVRSRPVSGESFVLDFEGLLDIRSAELAAQRLAMSPEVEFASPNGFARHAATSNDPSFGRQWNLTDPAVGINARTAWDITTGSNQIVVAVVDTGVLPHPEFSGRLLPGIDFITSAAQGNDGDGRDNNATDSGDWVTAGQCGAGAPAEDSSWHGTHVAGIIGASGTNGIGIAGVNWNSRILPVRVLGKCGGSDADILDGLRWAAGLPVPGIPSNPTPARVINMSLSGPGNCLTQSVAYQAAILEALANGASVVVAAGNDNEPALSRTPASCIGTIKVAAIGPTGDKASYSNYSKAIEIAAPGGDTNRFGDAGGVYSTVGSGKQSDPGSPSYASYQGTSMAAPHVAGVASLLLSVRPTLTVAQVRDILRVTARQFPAASSCRTSGECGLGIVDARAALELTQRAATRLNFSDLWFVSSEPGWGLNLQQQGDVVFGTWFTYGPNGVGQWLVMSGLQRVGNQDLFAGDIYVTTGVPFNQINGQRAYTTINKVGSALIGFYGVGININPNLDFDSAIFYYEVGNTAALKPIQRQFFAAPTICGFTTASRTGLTNYQDLWYQPGEDGWGINITHQGDILFATWFTYGPNGAGIWLVASEMRRGAAANSYTGKLYQTTGVPFDQIDGAQAYKTINEVGQLTLTFTNGERARMDYTVAGVTGSKQIQRQVFSTPLSACAPLQ